MEITPENYKLILARAGYIATPRHTEGWYIRKTTAHQSAQRYYDILIKIADLKTQQAGDKTNGRQTEIERLQREARGIYETATVQRVSTNKSVVWTDSDVADFLNARNNNR